MRLSLVVAMAENGAIGRDKRLPWHLPADLRHFRALTMGHPIIMGRRTFDSIGRVLPGRRNIVVTRNPDYVRNDVEVVHSLDEALAKCAADEDEDEEVFVIGGADLFAAALPLARRIYLTLVRATVEGDVFFEPLQPGEWLETERVERAADAHNTHACDFIIYDRRPGNTAV